MTLKKGFHPYEGQGHYSIDISIVHTPVATVRGGREEDIGVIRIRRLRKNGEIPSREIDFDIQKKGG